MTRPARLRIRRKRRSSSLHIAKSPIERRQLRPQIHNPQIHERATSRARKFLRRVHHPPAQPFALPCRINRQQSKIPTLAAQLHIDARDQRPAIFGKQILSCAQHAPNFRRINPITVDEKSLYLKRHVHQRSNRLCVAVACVPNFDLICHFSRIKSAAPTRAPVVPPPRRRRETIRSGAPKNGPDKHRSPPRLRVTPTFLPKSSFFACRPPITIGRVSLLVV